VHQQEGRRETLTPPGVIVAMKAASAIGSILRATLLGGVSPHHQIGVRYVSRAKKKLLS